MNKKLIVTVIALALCAGAALFILLADVKNRPDIPKSGAAQTDENSNVYTYTGNISSDNLQNCVSSTALVLKRIYVAEGGSVQKGDLLYLLDDSDIAPNISQALAGIQLAQVNLEKARLAAETVSQIAAKSSYDTAAAAYEEAKSNLDRVSSVQEFGGISQTDLEKAQIDLVSAEGQYNQAKINYETTGQQSSQNIRAAQAQLAQARAAYDAAKASESKRRVVAEIDGTVADIWANENNMLAAGQKIMDIVDYDSLILEIAVDQFEIALFEPGETVPVYIDAMNLTVDGVVSKISNQAIKTGEVSSFVVTVSLEKNPALRIGLLAEVKRNV